MNPIIHHANVEDLLRPFGGENTNNLGNLLSHNVDENEWDTTSCSPYVNLEQFSSYASSHTDNLSVLTLNCQSLNAKFDTILLIIEMLARESKFNFKLICLQETWHKDSDEATLFTLPNYHKPFDLPASCSKHGGLICYVHNSLDAELVHTYSGFTWYEGLFVRITGNNISPTLIGNFYRPPRRNNNNNVVQDFITEFSPVWNTIKQSKDDIIITGDFNIDLLKINEREKYANFLDLMLEKGLFPKIMFPTRFARKSASLIDQIYIRNKDHSSSQSGILLTPTSDHLGCFTIIDKKITRVKNPKHVTVTDFSSNALNNFSMAVKNINFMGLLDRNLFTNPNETYHIIEREINKVKSKHLPTKTVKFNKYKHKKSPWITTDILNSIKYRDKLYSKLRKCNPDSQDYDIKKQSLTNYNKYLNKLIKNAKVSYYDNEFSKHANDIKNTWATINKIIHRKRKTNNSPSHILSNNKKINNSREIVDTLNEYFSSIGGSLASQIKQPQKRYSDYLKQNITSSFSFDSVNSDDVLKILNKMKAKTSSDADGMSMILLKLIKEDLADPIALLINQSLASGIFPTKFKLAKVLPLMKKPNNYGIENFRPISLLNTVSKVLEKCVFNQVYNYFDYNKLFFVSQYGYRKCHSTENACLELIDRISHQLDSKQTPICLFLDLSKAFDTLDHNILLSKLQYYGLTDTPLKWFSSYLSERQQYVELDGLKSSTAPINTGVPQGSILGPLLFIIYINDINNASKIFNASLYADDTSLNTVISAFDIDRNNTISKKINDELSLINEWLASNKLSLNVAKTKFMLFRFPQKSKVSMPKLELQINGTSIEQVRTFDFLGLVINDTLSWKDHVNKISLKITKVIAVMRKIKHLVNSSILLKIYNSLILSRIHYGILCWGYEHKRIFTLQKKAIRVICKSRYNAHTDPLYKSLNLLKVKDIFVMQSVKFYYNHTHNNLPGYFNNMFSSTNQFHNYPTRNCQNIHIPRTRRHKTSKSLRYTTPRIVNNLPDAVRNKIQSYSFPTVKLHAKKHLLDSYQSHCTRAHCYVCQT